MAHLKIGNYCVSIILLIREICFDKIACMKSTSPVLGWCVCSGKCLVILWHRVFFYWWHTHCVIRSALCTLSVLIPTLKSLVLRIAQRYFSHGCQFKPRCLGFPKCCSQNFLRSGWFLCAFQSCFLAFFIPRNDLNTCFEKTMCSIFLFFCPLNLYRVRVFIWLTELPSGLGVGMGKNLVSTIFSCQVSQSEAGVSLWCFKTPLKSFSLGIVNSDSVLAVWVSGWILNSKCDTFAWV